MTDYMILIAIIVAVVFRVYIMRGSFVLPTLYRLGNEASLNLGSIATIIIGIIAALSLMYAQPNLFANPFVAFLTTYTTPQIADAIITKGVIYADNNNDDIQ